MGSKEAHRVRVQTRVRFQRRGFTSPIRARTRESESKGESDLLWTRESESKEGFDLLWTRESESKEESDFRWTGESDRVHVQGRVRSGKAFTFRLDLLGRALFGPLRKRALF